MRKIILVFALCLFLLPSICVLAQDAVKPAGQPTLQLETGTIAGSYNKKTGVYSYKGIPFATPPVGPFRWRAPQPALPWKGIRSCTEFAPSPMQPKPVPFLMIGPEFVTPASPLSEDCLYLNVWTSARSGNQKMPVIVWIYGGGFITGGAAAPGYSGEGIARQGVVFVSFNYRLGVFGFLAHPALTAESAEHSSGNYALMDQIAALKWVKKNISVFGGDPERITIAGQSAGSGSVNCLLASPQATDLFRGAIGESGSLVVENPILRMRSLKDAEKDGEKLASRLHAGDLSALRALSAEELQQKAAGFYAPIVDGYVMPMSVSEVYKKNKQIHVPLLTGWNADEGILLGMASREDFAKQSADFGSDSNLFKKYFPSDTDSASMNSQAALSLAKTMAVSEYAWAVKQNPNRAANTYLYVFTRKPPAEGDKKKFGAYHTAEIGYALNNLDSIHRPWTQTDYDLEKLMSAFWVQFVKTGDPNIAGKSNWQPFSKEDPNTMFFGVTTAEKELPNQQALDFLYARYPGNN